MSFLYLLKKLFSGEIKEAEFSLHIDTDDKPDKLNKLNLSKEQLDMLIEEIKKSTLKDVIKISLSDKENIGLTDSKFAGYPYWPDGKEYPVNDDGQKLILLAQINLSDVKNDLLPASGLLQFFIDCDDLSGLDQENGHKVVYHKDIDPSVTEESVKAQGIRAACDIIKGPSIDEEYFPLEECHGIEFNPSKEFIFFDDSTFEDIFFAKVKELFGKDKCEFDLSSSYYKVLGALNDDDGTYVNESFLDTAGHKLLGYPYFTQTDPRSADSNEILLFQMDSEDDIMWGDAGVGNFFITEADLKALNFENTRFNWDCC